MHGASLITPRLTMTPFAAGDFADCLAMRSDPVVNRFIGGEQSREDAWFRVLRHVGHWYVSGFGAWAVRETATGRFVGEIGFFDYRRNTLPDFAGTPEAGWVTATWAHGLGFASEAVAAMLSWADARQGFERTVAMIAAENTPSVRLARRVGYRSVSDVEYKGHRNLLFERVMP